VRYITFSTSTDTFGSSVLIDSALDYAEARIAVDSNNKPHIVYSLSTFDGSQYAEDLKYVNKVSGSWSTALDLSSTLDGGGNFYHLPGLAINASNIPVFSYNQNPTIYALIGNQNNATSFTTTTVTSSGSGVSYQALGIDSSGNVWIVYQNVHIEIREHLSASAWGTWQTASVSSLTASSNGLPTIAIGSSGTPYIFYSRNSDSFGVYSTYSGSWSSETVLQASSAFSLHPKWSYYFDNGNSSQMDYAYTSGTDAYWSKISFVANSAPATPTIYQPSSGATNVPVSPVFQVKSSDADNDYLRYKVLIYNSDCSTGLQTFDQTSSQAGWTQQNANTGTAYIGASTIGGSSPGLFGGVTLSASTTYCWKAAAIDPGGSNTFSSYSATQLFTTGATLVQPVNINGGTTINGGTWVR
jgi:hypothetical protein